MNNEMKCLRCGSQNVRPSDVQSTGKIYSCPRRSKFSAIFTSGALVNAMICLDCGHVELLVDTDKARSLVKA